MNDFLPKVENVPTAASKEKPSVDIEKAKERMNVTLSQFGMSS